MNERTEQLYKEAVNSASAELHEWNKNWQPGKHTNFEYEKVLYKKFAELIVRECADVLIENGDKQFDIRTVEPESHTKTTDWMEGYEEAVKHYGSFLLKKNAKLIKKHFGVE